MLNKESFKKVIVKMKKKSAKKAAKKATKKSMITRCEIVLAVVVFGLFGLDITSLVRIQLVENEYYQQKAERQQLSDTKITAQRGVIYDTNGKIIAQSATVWKIYIVPSLLKGDEEKRNKVADGLSEILGVEKEEIVEKSMQSNQYTVIKSKVENPEKEKVSEFILANKLNKYIGITPDSKRYYPLNEFASTVIGFTGADDQGIVGIEKRYDDVLTGIAGRIVTAKNAKQGKMPNQFETTIDAQQGNSLKLTIDEVIQYYLEKHIAQAVVDNNARSATGIVMDIKTGAILGMVTKPDFNSNDPWTLSESVQNTIDALNGDEQAKAITQARNDQWRNSAVSDTYEPGSVFKIITAAAALEEGTVHVDDMFECKGYVRVAGNTIRCSHREGHGTENLIQGMQNSCNPVFIKVAQDLGAEKFFKYFNGFGFTEKTDIDLPGESKSIASPGKDWNIATISSYSFGQTFQITPIQMITAISAIANGGSLMQPYLVQEILDENGNTVSKTQPTVKRQVISKETAQTVTMLMEAVTNGGTGKNAYAAGYRVAGKTGTSQKVGQKYEDGSQKWIASFGGFAPANDPRIAILISVDEPRGSSYYGGSVAAPIASVLFTEILSYLNVEPKYTEEELADRDIPMLGLVGESVQRAKDETENKGLRAVVIGDGEKVVSQSPAYGQPVPKNGTVILYTQTDCEKKTVKVPDFTGMTVSQANSRAKELGLNVRLSGNGLTESGVIASSQDIQVETQVEAGTIITVYFKHTQNVADF